MIYDECQTIIGHLRFALKENGTLTRVFLTNYHWLLFVENNTVKKSSELGEPIRQQFQEYLSGERKDFTLPFELEGTSFQKQVWDALQTIPYGETRSYFEIACSIGRPQAIRAIGHANSRNPLPIIFPCHRVIGKNQRLTGYAGGIGMKKQLLHIEGVMV
ncbi:methylated-DNA--[protein]-cysteine S-methyltransferase [Virgibacillus sp. NKC19-3]|uniref:methylated-DNA--[protein]-cysteine S-methyltransferase n=1 Tax=Virgibacillus saliphilus TaxID=2831674 RepID=UPI001C9B2296|nr:methylated-DNA--[protein]-cysteine S-methyltransferase [Virgibacillus sp. NKC19-3]MBY7144819.1 methylated-DNA--[protein]-cysteine S-methyltransferase [Virgibacillus sp. NKC19-3]